MKNNFRIIIFLKQIYKSFLNSWIQNTSKTKNKMLVVSSFVTSTFLTKKQMKYEDYIEEYLDLVKRFIVVQDKYNR